MRSNHGRPYGLTSHKLRRARVTATYEVTARRAGVLSAAWGYRGVLPDEKQPRETARHLETLLADNHQLHIIARTGVSAPRYDCGGGSFAIVYAEHEVVFLQSDQADRASGTWIDIPLHMNPLMRANGGYKGMTAQEALGVANGAEHRPAPALASGPRAGR